MDLPKEWKFMAIRDGLTWVAMSKTGVTTMQGKPITPEHFQAMAALAERKGLLVEWAGEVLQPAANEQPGPETDTPF